MSDQFGIKISDSSYDVVNADYDNLIFSSEYETLSARKKVTLSVTTSAVNGNGSNTYTHSSGYIPQIFAFVTTASYSGYANAYVNVPVQWVCPNDSGGTNPAVRMFSNEKFDCYSDANIVKVSAHAEVNDGSDDIEYLSNTYTFNIILFMEEARSS